MIGPQDGHRASIPEITTRHAADYSHDISLQLLDQIEQTVNTLTEMEHALEMVARVMYVAERSWDQLKSPAELPDDIDHNVDVLDKTAELLKCLGDVYLARKKAALDSRELNGENEDLVVQSYDRAIGRTCSALEAVESLKWTLMDLQALSEPASKTYDNVEELLADLKG